MRYVWNNAIACWRKTRTNVNLLHDCEKPRWKYGQVLLKTRKKNLIDVIGRYFGHFALQMNIFDFGFGRYYGENLIITK